jgi:L-amino acid N-acyltransferase YncA
LQLVKLLIDTNVLIQVEPLESDTGTLSGDLPTRLANIAAQVRCSLWVHPAQLIDIRRDQNSARRRLRETQFAKYQRLAFEVPPPPPSGPTNDWVDAQLVEAIANESVHGLITDDAKLRSRAAGRVSADRVYSLADAVEYLEGLTERAVRPPPAVVRVLPYTLDVDDPIWQTFREDYPGFDDWFTRVRLEHRPTWIVRDPSAEGRAGVAIANEEQHERIGAKTLKICSFKVSERHGGKRLGELLLKALFGYALENTYDSMFITAFEKHSALIALLTEFGFEQKQQKRNTGEIELIKTLELGVRSSASSDPFTYHVKHGPGALDIRGAQCFLIPIIPIYWSRLFPDFDSQTSLFPGYEACGNTLRKAYLCNSNTNLICPGATLLFYRSHDMRAVVGMGVAEKTLRSSDPDQLCSFVLPRTVYTKREIEQMTTERSVLAILFRQVLRRLSPSISVNELMCNGIVNTPPRSIVLIKDERKQWIVNRIHSEL